MENPTKLINVRNLKPGQVLSTDIYHYNNKVKLYSKGTILTEEKIERLKKFGFICIKVDKEINTINNSQEIIQENDLIGISQKNVTADFNEIYEHANYLVALVSQNKDVRKLITKIDEAVNDHSYKVAILSTMLGLNIDNITENDLQQLAIAGLLHDIGKSTIDFSILNKPGRLTKEEYELVKSHSQNGYDILVGTELFDPIICDTVLSHHENEDGTDILIK